MENLPACKTQEMTAIADVVSDVMKEIEQRDELRQRREVEGIGMTDEEFIAYADRTGLKI